MQVVWFKRDVCAHAMPRSVQLRAGCIIGRDYPAPMVEYTRAYHEARRRVYTIKASTTARAEGARVYHKHGSRRRPAVHRRSARAHRGGDS